MAGRGRTSYQKKQREQLRQERRQEKAARKEARKATKGDAFEIAWDEAAALKELISDEPEAVQQPQQ